MKFFYSFILLLIVLLFCSSYPFQNTEDLRINQIQIIGSHNSYRLKSYAPLFKYWSSITHPILKIAMQKSLDYSNDEPLSEQLSDYKLRGFEIDIYYDPQGGRYYNRLGNKLIKEPVESGIEALKQPGYKVMHVADFDYMTHHYTFIDALKTFKKWSDEHPDHLPIYIMVDTKDKNWVKLIKPKYCTDILPFTQNAVDSIDIEIKSVFGENSDKIITPDKVRGNYNTLNEAILNNSWPKISEARGKFIFILSGSTDAKNYYLYNHYSLVNRIMFMYSTPGNPEAAILKMDDPIENFSLIQNLSKQGYIIRTRADSQTKEARKKGNYKRYYKALESGAQIISTDYYKADERHLTSKKWSDYHIQFPDKNVARVNPVNFSEKKENIYLKD